MRHENAPIKVVLNVAAGGAAHPGGARRVAKHVSNGSRKVGRVIRKANHFICPFS